MSGFSAEWLALREPYDLAARHPVVRTAVTTWCKSAASVDVVDLACGSGSTVRALHSHLPARQHWHLVDHAPELLALACGNAPANDVTLNGVRLDLSRELDAALTAQIDLITTSALLDLVSETWLHQLLREAAGRALPIYAALTYDGRIELSPVDPFDAAIVAAVNTHQRTDKGFGPALGPTAAPAAIGRLEALGYSVARGRSDWEIGHDDRSMQAALLSGWAAAAREMDTLPRTDIDDWLGRREAAIGAGASSMRVGHVDFFASPNSTR
jgi:hypothetical protein